MTISSLHIIKKNIDLYICLSNIYKQRGAGGLSLNLTKNQSIRPLLPMEHYIIGLH